MANKKQQTRSYERIEGTTVSFAVFYSRYAAMEGFDHIPKFHWDMIDFLEGCDNWTNNVGVLQAFRGASKSSLTASWVAWRLARDPTLLFLIQSADDSLAIKMVTDIQKIVTTHPDCEHLMSPKNKWSERGFSVRGATSGRNLSVTARGIFSNVTGFRAHVLVYDDCEVLNTARSEPLREDLRIRISESARLLHPNGVRLFVGTPHTADSIYPEQIDRGASSFRVPFLQDLEGEWPYCTGTSSWPERWPVELIAQVQHSCRGRAEFYSQYQLIAVSAEDSALDMARLNIYTDEPEFIEANGDKLYRLFGARIKSHCAFWDPALSKAGGDSSVLSICVHTEDGRIIVHRTIALHGGIEEQCKQIRKLVYDFYIPVVYIESNGIGGWADQILRKHVVALDCAVVKKHTSTKKSESILTAYETPISAGILWVHQSVMDGPFSSQLRDFNPRHMRGADDFIDAAAKGIHQLKVVLGGSIKGERAFSPYRMHATDIEFQRDYALTSN